jgi:hypothetical protein
MTAESYFWSVVAAGGIMVAGIAVLAELRHRRHKRRDDHE